MRTLIVSQDSTFRVDLPPAAVSELLHSPHNVVWLDIQDPTADDIAYLREEFGFHPLAIEDADRSHERPKVDAYASPPIGPDQLIDLSDEPVALGQPDFDLQAAETVRSPSHGKPNPGNYYFLVFYTAAYDPEHDHIVTQAVNMFIGANFLVTVHRGPCVDVADTQARWQARGSSMDHKIGAIVHALLDAIVDDYFPLMDRVADRVEDLEDSIFVQFEERAIQTMFGLKKDLLHLRRVVAPERDVLNVLLRRQLPVFGPDDIAYLQDVYDHIVRVTDNVDTYRDLLSSALDSYLSLQSNNLNQVVKVLTIASIILMAASLIAGIYGMNFSHMPELGWRIGHGWAIIVMVVITAALVIYFRRKRWL